jgi:hypothetical protein
LNLFRGIVHKLTKQSGNFTNDQLVQSVELTFNNDLPDVKKFIHKLRRPSLKGGQYNEWVDKLFGYLEDFGADKLKEPETGDISKTKSSIKDRITKNSAESVKSEGAEEGSLAKRTATSE